MGIKEEDGVSLDILFEFLMPGKRRSVTKKREIPKDQVNRLTFDVSRIVFMSKTRSAQAHLKAFKRFCKVLTTDLVDVYPRKKQHLLSLVSGIVDLSQSTLRLMRYGFT